MTRVFGVVGYPISHSLSPLMHTAAFDALGLDAIYAPFEVPPRVLGPVFQGLAAAGIDGLNITVPHKERIMRSLNPRTDLDESASVVGAVNTLVRKGSRFIGYNTDVAGFRQVLREALHWHSRGKRILLLGTGGAARAVGWVLTQAVPERITVANRTPAHTNRFIRWLRRAASRQGTHERLELTTIPFERRAIGRRLQEVDLLVNATSLGLRLGDPLPVPPRTIRKGLVVVDLVYRAPTTKLVLEARRRGALAVDGLPMLVYQGAESFRLWWHRPPPIDVMRRAVEQALRTRSR